MNHKKITLDIERKSFESIIAMQGDNKSRYIDATIVNRSIPVDLTGCTVKFSAIKPDLTDIFNDAVIIDAKGGKVQIELTNQTLAVPGVIQATLVILKEDMQLSVLPFFITVIENPYNPNAIESKPEYQALNNALIVADGYAKELQDASVNLEEKYTTRLNNFGSQLEHKVSKKDYCINIKDCGVKGGIENSTNDTEKIKVAIELARSLFKPLYIPKGEYFIKECLDFFNIPIIFGDGISASILKCNAPLEKFIININMARVEIKNICIDGNGQCDYCIDTSFNSYTGPSLNILHKNIIVKGYRKIGWIANNNNDVWWENVVIIEPSDKKTSLGSLQVYGSGGPNQFLNCNFLDDLLIGGQYNSLINTVVDGITVNGDGFNTFKIEGSYLFPSTKTKCVFYLPENCELASVSFSNPHIELYQNTYLVGGSGKLHYGLNCQGGHIFNPTESKGGELIQSTINHIFTAPTNSFNNVWFNNINLDNFKNGHMLNSFISCYLDGNKFDTFKVGTYSSSWSEITTNKVEICNTIDGKGLLNQLFYLSNITTNYQKIPIEFDERGNFIVQVRGMLNDSPYATFLIGLNGGYGANVVKLLDGKGIGDFNDIGFLMEYNQGLKIKIDKTANWDKIPQVKISVIGI